MASCGYRSYAAAGAKKALSTTGGYRALAAHPPVAAREIGEGIANAELSSVIRGFFLSFFVFLKRESENYMASLAVLYPSCSKVLYSRRLQPTSAISQRLDQAHRITIHNRLPDWTLLGILLEILVTLGPFTVLVGR